MLLKEIKILFVGYHHYRTIRKFRNFSEEEKNKSSFPVGFVTDLIAFGPLFIKLGQILSTRPDILPNQYITALGQLCENVPPCESTTIREIVEKELGQSVQHLFQSFGENPVASASLAQVHFAVLHSGEKVALKILRPEVSNRITQDLRLLEKILSIVKILVPRKIKRANLLEGFREFKRYTLQELDFVHEANTIDRFRINFQTWEDILVPRIYWNYTTSRILTMEKVSGMRLNEATSALSTAEKEHLTHRLAEMELKMFISDGLFHADLHPGNIFFRKDGKIVLLDFGMYGQLNEDERDRFVLYWMAVSQNQVNRAFYHFRKQCRELPHANEEAFFNRFRQLADSFYHNRLIETSITKVYISMIEAGYKYGYIFPAHLLLHAKALTTAEALTFELSPDARFEKLTGPLITREFAKLALNGKHFKSKLGQQLPELLLTGELSRHLPFNSAGESSTDIPWEELFSEVMSNIKGWSSEAGLFRHILNRPAREILQNHFSEERTEKILNGTWEEYQISESSTPKQQSLGATFTVHLAEATIALFNALIREGENRDAATGLVYRIGWKVYKKMAEIPMLVAGMFSDNPRKRMEIATLVFRQFPFSAPDYDWEDVKTGNGITAFNCTRCPVANLFIKRGMGDVCYSTWCKLDFPLAEKWKGKLERNSSIAGGATVCDFRFIAETN